MSHGPTMSQAVYVLGSQGFDPMWEEACADAWRTDIYVNVRTHESLFVFATSSGAHPVSFLDGGQARVAWPDNESSSLCPREPGL